MRSLESVTGALATTNERVFRQYQIVIHRETFAGFADNALSLDILIQAVEAERENIRNLIEHITQFDSPLGIALRGLDICEDDVFPKRASEMIQDGEQLILLAAYHAAHLGLGADPHTLISLSDGNKELLLEPWHRIHILKLTPKPITK